MTSEARLIHTTSRVGEPVVSSQPTIRLATIKDADPTARALP
jgi:hypothetical protein